MSYTLGIPYDDAVLLEVPSACIDEWRGRRAARAVGLRVTGTLGLLGRAKRLGRIERVAPWVEKLARAGVHYHPESWSRGSWRPWKSRTR